VISLGVIVRLPLVECQVPEREAEQRPKMRAVAGPTNPTQAGARPFAAAMLGQPPVTQQACASTFQRQRGGPEQVKTSGPGTPVSLERAAGSGTFAMAARSAGNRRNQETTRRF
jgi:hypothetical protein